MPLVTMLKLPCLTVPWKLGHQWFRAPAVLECRHFSMFKESQRIDVPIVRPQITPALLPYTIALMEASRLPSPLVGSSVMGLLDNLYCRPDRLAARARQLPNCLIQQINSTHGRMDAMATDFAASALMRISRKGRAMATSIPLLSPAEHFRFCRAFYRVELFQTLFRGDAFADKMKSSFFSKHPPWENEQLACVCNYLEIRLDQVLAEFHKDGTKVFEQGGIEDWELRSSWLSQGVEFISSLVNAPSPEAKRNILQAGIGAAFDDGPALELPDTLEKVYSDDEHSHQKCKSVALHQYSQVNGEDNDSGPSQVWRTKNAEDTVAGSFLFGNEWLRDCAYVFWDRDRVQKMGEFDLPPPGYWERRWEVSA